MYDNINIINSKLYREGPDHLHENSPDRIVFYKVTKDKEEWIPLPERLIMRAKKHSEQILKASPAQTFANNVPEDIKKCVNTNDQYCAAVFRRRGMSSCS